MAVETTTVRIPLKTKRVLDEMARRDRLTVQHELVMLIEDARRRRMLEETREAYDAMSSETWEALDSEHRAWEITLADGLKGL